MPRKGGLVHQLWRWLSKQAIPLLIVAGAIALSVVMVNVAATRPLSTLELVLWQVVSLLLGLSGSYWFGRNAAKDSARDVIRPHARSALRTIISLWASLHRLSDRIAEFQSNGSDHRLDIIQAIIWEMIPNGRSAIEDWRDIVPEDVDEVFERWMQHHWPAGERDDTER